MVQYLFVFKCLNLEARVSVYETKCNENLTYKGETDLILGRCGVPSRQPEDRPLLLRQQLPAGSAGAAVHRHHREEGGQATPAHERNRIQEGYESRWKEPGNIFFLFLHLHVLNLNYAATCWPSSNPFLCFQYCRPPSSILVQVKCPIGPNIECTRTCATYC